MAGASGSGKTLLLRALAGLDRLDEGTVTHGGREHEEWRMPEYRARVTYLAQTPALVEGTVEENLRLPFGFRVHGDLARDRRRIGTLLALGASRWEAARHDLREALRTGLIPVVNSMMIMGVVSLPGMMTGQILAGADPGDAVRYQIMIMCMIASCVALATLGILLLAYLALFSPNHRLRSERISRVGS